MHDPVELLRSLPNPRPLLISRSAHQQRVDAFKLSAGQKVPSVPTLPSEKDAEMLAALLLEETLETIHDLGVKVTCLQVTPGPDGEGVEHELVLVDPKVDMDQHGEPSYEYTGPQNIVGAVDGALDVRVVATGLLSGLGVPDLLLQEEVDWNNLSKFGPGHTFRADGKLVKPPGHKPPRIREILSWQGAPEYLLNTD